MRAAVAAALLLAVAPVAAQEPAPTVYSGQPRAAIPLRRSPDGKLLARVEVEGRMLTLLVDTGASTVLDMGVARGLGLAIGETAEIGYGLTGVTGRRHGTVINRMVLGGIVVSGLPASCLDLAPLRAVEGVPPFDGVIGSELMAVLRARIDFDSLTLVVRRPDRASIAEELRRRAPPPPKS